jgi:hypothetical protein
MDHAALNDIYHISGTPACPSCGAKADGAAATPNSREIRPPEPGDFAICANCGSINHYNDQLQLVKTQPPELIKVATDDPELFSTLFKSSLYFAGLKATEDRYNLGRN